MADVITRLKLESSEYDSKIKRATEGLLQMEQECRKVGGTLAILEKDQLEFVKGLGQMETVSKNARGKLSELTQAYTELSMQYKRLTDEEKKGDFGKALSASLEQLKTRIGETKTQLGDITKEMNGGGGLKDALDAVAGKFGLSIDQVTKFGGVLAVTGTAVKVAKDAFFASEATVDEWGRTVASAESVYEGFLNALNNMDISGFLSRIDEIVSAARAAYNELDRLGTMKTIQAPQISAQQTENDRIRMMIQTGRYIGSLDGRKEIDRETGNVMQNGQQLTERQIKVLEQKLTEGTQKVVDLVSNEVKQTTAAIDAVYKRQGAELGMSVKEFRKGTSSMAEFEKRLAGAEKYNQYESQHTNTVYNPATGGWSQKRDNSKNPYEAYKGWDVFRVDGDRYNQLVQLIQQRDQQASQAYSMQSQAYRAINRAEGTTVRDIMNGNTGGRGSGGGVTTAKETYVAAEGSIDAQAEKVKNLTKLWSAATDQAGRDGYKKQLDEAQAVLDQMRGKVKDVTQEMATGISGLTPEMISWGQADIKKQMQTVELGSEEYNNLADRLIDYNAVSNLMQEAVKSGLEIDDSVKEYFVEALTGPLGENIPQALYDSLVESLNDFRDYAGENPIEIDTKTGSVKESKTKEGEKSDQQLQKITSGMSQVISGLQMVGIKVPESIQTALTVIQGAMTLVQGVSSLITVIQSATVPSQIAAETANTTASVANTAALSALTAAVWANTASSFIPFANGGIVPHAADGYFVGGNRFSGDLTPIMANAGELILNKTQQSTLAQELERGDEDSIGGQPYVTGEMIYLGLNNYTKANGYGEVVTTRR